MSDNNKIITNIDFELKELISNIKSGAGIDPKSWKSHSDGELLAMYLNGVMQSNLLRLDDREDFKNNFKF